MLFFSCVSVCVCVCFSIIYDFPHMFVLAFSIFLELFNAFQICLSFSYCFLCESPIFVFSLHASMIFICILSAICYAIRILWMLSLHAFLASCTVLYRKACRIFDRFLGYVCFLTFGDLGVVFGDVLGGLKYSFRGLRTHFKAIFQRYIFSDILVLDLICSIQHSGYFQDISRTFPGHFRKTS